MHTWIYVAVPSFLAYTILVVLMDRRWLGTNKNKDTSVNKPPVPILQLTDEEKAILPFYQAEWKAVIETQMHFNDLIIRFRSIILTAFITLIGASLALKNTEHIDKIQVLELLAMAGILWITACVMDYGYYHRLLLGSVRQALKFDNSELGKKYGLFGLTTCISDAVHPPTSKIMVGLFYAIPGIGIVLLFLCVYYFMGNNAQ